MPGPAHARPVRGRPPLTCFSVIRSQGRLGGEWGAIYARYIPAPNLATQRFKEGAPMTSGGGAISLPQHPPHPNAAKVFINWLLSREGQMAWQRRTTHNSLRIDIPKEGLNPKNTPIPGQSYTFMSTEKYYRTRKEIKDFFGRLLNQLGK